MSKDRAERPTRGSTKGTNPDTIVGGFVRTYFREHGTEPTVTTPVPDELSQAAVDVDNHPRPWTKLPRNRKGKLALMGISSALLDKGDPRYARALRLANSYRKTRQKELSYYHGHVSSGASMLLASGSLAVAASRFLYEKAAEDGDQSLLIQAARLADSARQSELAAWEMSAREGLVRRKLEAANSGVPWLTVDEPVRQKAGRKTNEQRKALELEGPKEQPDYVVSVDEVIHG